MSTSSEEAVIRRLDCERWTELSPRFLDGNYRQSWAFAKASAARVGARSEPVGVQRGDSWVGISDVRIKRLPLGLGGIAYLNGGPMVRQRGDPTTAPAHLRACLEALCKEYVERRGLVLRILAPLGSAAWNQQAAKIFEVCGFSRTDRSKAYRTISIDITRPAEEIRKSLHQKWRNCLNKAERQGLELEAGEDPALLDEFCELFHRFVERKGFDVDLGAGFYARVQREHLSGEAYYTCIARQEERVVAGVVASMLGDTCVYLLGATHPDALKSNAAYLLQWHTILTARDRGLAAYDLGGIDPEGNPGVYRFKERMGGEDLLAAGPYELAPRGLRGSLARGAEAAYRGVKRFL